jgi:hypothetical protein
VQPAVAQCLCGGLGIIDVTRAHLGSAQQDLTGFARSQGLVIRTRDDDFHALHGEAHRAKLLAPVTGIDIGHAAAAFGHAITFGQFGGGE